MMYISCLDSHNVLSLSYFLQVFPIIPPQSNPTTHSQIQQIIILIIPPLPSTDHNLLLLLILSHGGQEFLQLSLGDLLPQLARPRQRDQPVLDVGRARLLDESDAAQSVRGLGVQDLVQDRLAGFGLNRGRGY